MIAKSQKKKENN